MKAQLRISQKIKRDKSIYAIANRLPLRGPINKREKVELRLDPFDLSQSIRYDLVRRAWVPVNDDDEKNLTPQQYRVHGMRKCIPVNEKMAVEPRTPFREGPTSNKTESRNKIGHENIPNFNRRQGAENELEPRHENIGRIAPHRKNTCKDIELLPKSGPGKKISTEVLIALQRLIAEEYLAQKRISVHHLYHLLLAHIAKINEYRSEPEKLVACSMRTVYRFVNNGNRLVVSTRRIEGNT
jgi:hypothetical protein